jgi:uncharacterized protein (TIGR00369 family)
MDRLDTLNAFMARAPFHQWLGCRVTAFDEATGETTILLPARDELRRAPDDAGAHGGIVTALVDLAAHAALNAVTGTGLPTIDLRTDFLRPAVPPLTALAKPRRVGRSIGVVDVEVTGADGRLAALGRVVYSLAAYKVSGS